MNSSQAFVKNTTAILFVMNDIARDIEDEFNDWYDTQHVPERLSIDGFLSASRWHALGHSQAYMATYHCKGIETLEQSAYLERLENPTPWTREIMPHFSNVVRSVCHETWMQGADVGTHAIVIRCVPQAGMQTQGRDLLIRTLTDYIATNASITRVALWEAAGGLVAQASPEEALRGEIDQRVSWVVFIQCAGLVDPSVQINMSSWFESADFKASLSLEACAQYQRLSQHNAQPFKSSTELGH